MYVTAQEEYGLRCAARLASLAPGATLSAPEIAAAEGLSVEYVSKFMLLLKRAELIRTVRGVNGGFALAREAQEISLKEVFDALSGKKKTGEEFCKSYSGKSETCVRTDSCTIRPFWKIMSFYVEEFTKNMSLSDLIQSEEQTLMKTTAIAKKNVEQLLQEKCR